jgi:adenosylmethionine-8-amino-7-oxononanoate aminotransferase
MTAVFEQSAEEDGVAIRLVSSDDVIVYSIPPVIAQGHTIDMMLRAVEYFYEQGVEHGKFLLRDEVRKLFRVE